MTQAGTTIAYVIPVHNEERVLPLTVKHVVERLRDFPGSEIILVENGSTDSSPELVEELATSLSNDFVMVRAEVACKGLGNALRHGIGVATADRLILTAADLPFGFSDLDAALELEPMPDVVIGSKTHPRSKVQTNAMRTVMSGVFRLVKRVLFSLDIADTQGSVNIERTLAQRLFPHLVSEGYFISTEVVVLAVRARASVAEVPVEYSNPRTDSKVRPVADSFDVLMAMIRMRKRMRGLDLSS